MISPRSRIGLAALTALATAVSGPAASPADLFPAYFGRWRVAEAHPAPWTSESSPAPADDGLVDRTVTYEPTRILGPRPLRCARPDYGLADVPPEALFQGNLPRPAADARALGFAAGPVRTLQTACADGIALHFRDAETMLFALNNLIYRLKKVDLRAPR